MSTIENCDFPIPVGGMVYFIGIGGISMSALASVTAAFGIRVAGCDRADTELTRRLQEKGILVEGEDVGAGDGLLSQAALAVYTAAIPAEHPKRKEAAERGIPTLSRAEYLGRLMLRYRHRIGVAGMHGKSTVTSMLAEIFLSAEKDPTVLCGAELASMGGAYRLGGEEYFLFEACEYKDSFLSFFPTTAVLLNMDLDHVDYFPSLERIGASFLAYAGKAQRIVYFADDPQLCRALSAYEGERVCYSLMGQGDYTAEDIVLLRGGAEFTVSLKGRVLTRVRLRVTGRHNVQNALAAFAVAHAYGIAPDEIASTLFAFVGAKRRMEYLFDWNGAAVYSDYAHHPTELRAAISAAREMTEGRVLCVFQPHTYSRTAALLSDFAAALRLADLALIAPTYAAREENTFGIDEGTLADAIGEGASALADADAILPALRAAVKDGDMVLLLGAGDLFGEGASALDW